MLLVMLVGMALMFFAGVIGLQSVTFFTWLGNGTTDAFNMLAGTTSTSCQSAGLIITLIGGLGILACCIGLFITAPSHSVKKEQINRQINRESGNGNIEREQRMEYSDAIKIRRSQYALTNTIKVPEEKVVEVIKESIKHTPSPYNIQSTRAMVLLGENHKKLWQIVKEVLLEKIGAERFVATEEKINKNFLSGYGTILFFIDEAVVKENAQKISKNFYGWANESAAMAQVAVWTGLSDLGLGASLQHYNPIIDQKTKAAFEIAENWKPISQMPFGDIIAEPKVKEFKDIDTLVKVKR